MQIEEYVVPIEEFPAYSVSNYGRVISNRYDRDLVPVMSKDGYLKVRLYVGRRLVEYYVHDLVAEAFFLGWRIDSVVEHISDDKTDNSVGNLRLKKVVD